MLGTIMVIKPKFYLMWIQIFISNLNLAIIKTEKSKFHRYFGAEFAN